MEDPFRYVLLKLASRCNLACSYCYWFRDPLVYVKPPYLTEEAEGAFVRRIEEFSGVGISVGSLSQDKLMAGRGW